MGTRGLWGFHVDGQTKVSYNHWDSYPSGLGRTIGDFVAASNPQEVMTMARGLTMVEEGAATTPEQQKALAGFANTSVSGQTTEEWYVLLRECQGDPEKTLASKVMIDSFEFGHDSLFCEWGYVIDFDAGELVVYRGFQKVQPTKGLWKDAPAKVPTASGYVNDYWSIKPVMNIPLDQVTADAVEKAEELE